MSHTRKYKPSEQYGDWQRATAFKNKIGNDGDLEIDDKNRHMYLWVKRNKIQPGPGFETLKISTEKP